MTLMCVQTWLAVNCLLNAGTACIQTASSALLALSSVSTRVRFRITVRDRGADECGRYRVDSADRADAVLIYTLPQYCKRNHQHFNNYTT